MKLESVEPQLNEEMCALSKWSSPTQHSLNLCIEAYMNIFKRDIWDLAGAHNVPLHWAVPWTFHAYSVKWKHMYHHMIGFFWGDFERHWMVPCHALPFIHINVYVLYKVWTFGTWNCWQNHSAHSGSTSASNWNGEKHISLEWKCFCYFGFVKSNAFFKCLIS